MRAQGKSRAAAKLTNLSTARSLDSLSDDAVTEAFANDISMVFCPTPEHLFICKQEGRDVVFLNATRLDPGFDDFQGRLEMDGVFFQGTIARKSEEEEVKEQKHDKRHVKLSSSTEIQGLGEAYALAIALCDRDRVGPTGGNYGSKRVGDVQCFMNIDLGNAFGDSSVIPTLQPDFSFEQPGKGLPMAVRRHKMYRNFSIFKDTTLADKMKGLHLLCRYAGLPIYESLMLSKKTVAQLDDAFRARWQAMSKNGIAKLAKRYRDLVEQASLPQDRKAKALARLSQMESQFIANVRAMLEVMVNRITLAPEDLESLDCFEKIAAGLTFQNECGSIKFNFPQLKADIKPQPWQNLFNHTL